MPAPESLDEILSRQAAVFADQIRAAAEMADTEADIRIETERQLAFIERDFGSEAKLAQDGIAALFVVILEGSVA